MDDNKKVKFIYIFIASVLSLSVTVQLYKYLYAVCHYSNLKDFYSGISIYSDHNKYLDIYVYFIYLLIFFVFLFLISFLRRKIKRKGKEIFNKKEKPDKKDTVISSNNSIYNILQKIKEYIIKYQYVALGGFIFLHPIDGIFYPKIAVLIFLIIAAGIFDIRRRRKNPSFSPFTITAVVFLLFFTAYNTGFAPSDDHHFGEKFAVFFMHNHFNLDYYKDIMLVHGYIDVIPSWIGAYLFDENNIYGYCLGEIFFKNSIFILIILSAAFIFKNNLLFIVPLLLLKSQSVGYLFFCVYLLMLKKEILSRYGISLTLYIFFSSVFILMWTTIGTFWAIAALPFAFYAIYRIIKLKDFKQFILPAIAVLFLSLLFGKTFLEYFKVMPYYVQGNLFAFGNKFEYLLLYFPKYLNFFYKMFALFFVPVLIIELYYKIKNKDTENILFLLFFTIFPLVSLPYTAGRIDGELMQRFEYISAPYLLLVMPYFLYKFSNKNYKVVLQIILIFALLSAIFNFPVKAKILLSTDIKQESKLYNTGRISLKPEEEKRLNDLKTFVYKEGSEKSFFDLTNGGMLYLYLNKKIPVQYSSFYNSISSIQSDISAERIKKNPPDIVLIKSKFNMHDNIYPSLRVNSIYRLLLLDMYYKFEEYNGNIFLVKSKEETPYTKEQLEQLDTILGLNNLNFLPEVWAKSLNTLPLKKVNPAFYSYITENKIVIKFLNAQFQKNIDFVLIDTSNAAKYKIAVNNSSSALKCKSRTGKILVPLDNFPSWLLNENLNEIIIDTETTALQNLRIEFYNKINKS